MPCLDLFKLNLVTKSLKSCRSIYKLSIQEVIKANTEINPCQ